ncbi:PEP/pyruvate-binding domain-containing protein [Bacteroidota bacterium]
MPHRKPIEKLVIDLQERTKELNCLYTIEDSLNRSDISLRTAFHTVINAIPAGWQFPDVCKAKLIYGDKIYQTSEFEETSWYLLENIVVQDKVVGEIFVYYTKNRPQAEIGPFLKEEKKLLSIIAERLGHFVLHQKLKTMFSELDNVKHQVGGEAKGDWRIVLEMIRKTEPTLFMSLLRKLLHQLCWKGVEDAELLLKNSIISQRSGEGEQHEDDNRPMKVKRITNYDDYVEAILQLAGEFLSDEVILTKIQKWIQDDKSSGLVKIVENQDTSLTDIADAIRKYYHIAPEKFELSPSTIKGLRVSLLRRFFTDQLNFISIAKEYVKLTDFYNLIDRMIFPQKSHGKLGGKSAGLFLAYHILQKNSEEIPILKDIKAPKTWYLTSDGVLNFLQHNNLEEVYEQKYKEVDEIRLEYPHIVQLFKSSQFSPDIVKGLSVALDDFGDVPLVVRSSSLLEDQLGAAFSGKYKSLFLANQGSKSDRLEALMDAIAEVYASTFSPDPIEYRAERGLLDFHEEMGIMIQEVVGKKVGNYFLPAFAGVAFSNNEFRWSPRIKREDGLVRLVPGLGTRAVDRLADDYPILAAPGQPSLKVNVSVDETIHYSPKKIDVIDLETNQFETIEASVLFQQLGDKYPAVNDIISVVSGTMIRQPGFDTDYQKDEIVVTFNGLLSKTNFVKKFDTILKTLQAKLNTPVDIEFASDGEDLYILQCRPQSFAGDITADPIPKDLPEEKVIFSAHKYISNGKVPDVTHIVYIHPENYSMLPDREKMLQVGRAVGKLNKMLPKRNFILMGPGRWGSRGDIKLGVNVTYADISNTSMLIEIAMKKGKYVPDLSFGTHFFQDLVESQIRYLPLYPDDEGILFNREFFENSENILEEMIPEFAHLKDVVKVIDVPNSTEGYVLKVLANAEIDTAVGMLAEASTDSGVETENRITTETRPSDHWRWRYKMAEKIAIEMDVEKFGVKGLYLFGSTKNAIAGPGSDIDLIIHLEENKDKQSALELWLEGWSICLGEMNYLRTGYKSEGLLDVHFVTDKDIEEKNSYAVKIGAVTDAAKPLRIIN